MRICLRRWVDGGLTFDAKDVHGPLILEPLDGVLHATTVARQGSERAQSTGGLWARRKARLADKRCHTCMYMYLYLFMEAIRVCTHLLDLGEREGAVDVELHVMLVHILLGNLYQELTQSGGAIEALPAVPTSIGLGGLLWWHHKGGSVKPPHIPTITGQQQRSVARYRLKEGTRVLTDDLSMAPARRFLTLKSPARLLPVWWPSPALSTR